MSKDRELYMSVKTFSQAVNNCQPFARTSLPTEKRLFIIGQVTSEMLEMAQSHTDNNAFEALLEQTDATVDAMYYIADTAARHGLIPDPTYRPAVVQPAGKTVLSPEQVKAFGKKAVMSLLPLYSHHNEIAHETILWKVFCDLRSNFYAQTGIDPLDFFEIVHKANLSKLDADGKPHKLRDDGKIMKPDDFVPPAGPMAALLKEQMV